MKDPLITKIEALMKQNKLLSAKNRYLKKQNSIFKNELMRINGNVTRILCEDKE